MVDPDAFNTFEAAGWEEKASAYEKVFGSLTERQGGNARVEDFIKYSEKVSGKSLSSLFDTWLYKTSKPKKPALGGEVNATNGKQERPESWDEIQAVHGAHRH